MTPAVSTSAIEFVPPSYFAPVDLGLAFPRTAPLEIDLGCGDGAFLVALAEKFPERNFLGIERLLGRVRSACAKAERRGLRNIRVIRIESSYAIQYLLPPCAAAVIHLLFPDPWPKRRHQGRRVVTEDFIAAVHRVLAPDGDFRIATDDQDYFQAIRRLISPALFSENTAANSQPAFPLTTFEKHFQKRGVPIYRLWLRKIS
jgi:tRNA (guanine-N7-)-methyltransferase